MKPRLSPGQIILAYRLCRDGRIGLSLGFDLTESVRAAILALPAHAWRPTLTRDDSERDGELGREPLDHLLASIAG
jgi:hypothetical protein